MKLLHCALAITVALALVASVDAADKAAKKKGAVAGRVEKVDGQTIVVKTGKKKDVNAPSVTLTLTDQTKFAIQNADGKKDGKLSDVAVGKTIQFTKETKDGKEVITSVTVVEAKKKKDK